MFRCFKKLFSKQKKNKKSTIEVKEFNRGIEVACDNCDGLSAINITLNDVAAISMTSSSLSSGECDVDWDETLADVFNSNISIDSIDSFDTFCSEWSRTDYNNTDVCDSPSTDGLDSNSSIESSDSLTDMLNNDISIDWSDTFYANFSNTVSDSDNTVSDSDNTVSDSDNAFLSNS